MVMFNSVKQLHLGSYSKNKSILKEAIEKNNINVILNLINAPKADIPDYYIDSGKSNLIVNDTITIYSVIENCILLKKYILLDVILQSKQWDFCKDLDYYKKYASDSSPYIFYYCKKDEYLLKIFKKIFKDFKRLNKNTREEIANKSLKWAIYGKSSIVSKYLEVIFDFYPTSFSMINTLINKGKLDLAENLVKKYLDINFSKNSNEKKIENVKNLLINIVSRLIFQGNNYRLIIYILESPFVKRYINNEDLIMILSRFKNKQGEKINIKKIWIISDIFCYLESIYERDSLINKFDNYKKNIYNILEKISYFDYSYLENEYGTKVYNEGLVWFNIDDILRVS